MKRGECLSARGVDVDSNLLMSPRTSPRLIMICVCAFIYGCMRLNCDSAEGSIGQTFWYCLHALCLFKQFLGCPHEMIETYLCFARHHDAFWVDRQLWTGMYFVWSPPGHAPM
jgi:hypothetical protein